MSKVTIKNGLVYDPLNKINGEKIDISIENGKIVENNGGKVIDASGCIVFPGGVEIHAHISGAKVNTGRSLRPEDHRKDPVARTSVTRAGAGYSVPTTYVTSYRYAQMGYTTGAEPAVPLIKARHNIEEFGHMPILDWYQYPVFANNWYVLRCVAEKDIDMLAAYVSWIMKVTKGWAIKLVNPGGVENFGWGKNVDNLDDTVLHWEVSPREIITALMKVNEKLGLPHSIHIHCNNLGHPGCSVVTKETFKLAKTVASGNKNRKATLHMTHVQFNAYGGTGWKDFCSDATAIAEYINQNDDVTFDVGQVGFANTTTMTGDGPWEYSLSNLSATTGWGSKGFVKWVNAQAEAESGGGVVPYIFSSKSPVNAIQWAIGMELLLSIKNMWQAGLTTDHPNGAPFTFYPHFFSLLMSKSARNEALSKVHSLAKERTTLGDIDRELTLEEIAIISRAGTAKNMGLSHKGHLGVGADGDVAIYRLSPEEKDAKKIEKALSRAAYTIKSGNIVVKDGEVVATPMGKLSYLDITLPEKLSADANAFIDKYWNQHYTIQKSNYIVKDSEVTNPNPISWTPKL
ncbi:MAG: formylmethanofuran dehydrogenase subunit A [Candidatus Lokiarchaeota archaeon]|nr:formylmethanofuran dehydrogenase subunit A [Candidatus Lokiarchaeota archaeon]